jgi:rhodanese-related sulfurtransferase
MASSASTLLRPQVGGDISREELYRRLGDPSLAIVDVLPNSAYNGEHIPGAINLPLAELAARAPGVLANRAGEIAVYCASFT